MSAVSLPGYQETPIGWLPIAWSVFSFGSLLAEKPEYGANASAENFVDGYVRYVRITDIDDAGGLIPSNSKYLPPDEAKDYLLSDNDIVIARTGNTVGKSLRYRSHMGPCAFAGYLIRFRVGPSISPEYVAQYVRSDAYWSWVKSSVKVGAQPNINSQQYQSLLLPVPPLPEQQKIAAILSAVDDKLDVIARQIDATHTLKQGLMQTLFSRGVGTQDADGRWVPHVEFKDSELGKIPAGWSVRSLGSVTEEVRERNSGKLDDALLCGVLKEQGLVPMRERVKGATTERCRVVGPSAFAYNPMRINIGSIARNLRDHSVMVSPDYVVFATRSELLLPGYLDHFRRSDEWQRFVGRSGDGGVRIRIYYDDLAQLRMKVPPLSEQVKVVEILDCMTTKLKQLIMRQAEFQKLKRGLMQKLLTGEWRVSLDAKATET